MGFVRQILFIPVIAILLLHAFLPHQHHGEMSVEEHETSHQSAHDILDLFELAFHQGADNYSETFTYTTGSSEYNFLIAFTPDFGNLYTRKFDYTLTPLSVLQPHKLLDNYHIAFNQFRGPPLG